MGTYESPDFAGVHPSDELRRVGEPIAVEQGTRLAVTLLRNKRPGEFA